MQTGANSVEVCGDCDETLKSVDKTLVDGDNCCLNFGIIVVETLVVVDFNELCLFVSGTSVEIDTADDFCELTSVDKTVDGDITGISNDVDLLIGISDVKVVTEIKDGTIDTVVVDGERVLIDFSDNELNGIDSVDVMELIGSFEIIENSIDLVDNCDEFVVDSKFTVLSIDSSVIIVALSSDVNWYVVSSVDMLSFSWFSDTLLKS